MTGSSEGGRPQRNKGNINVNNSCDGSDPDDTQLLDLNDTPEGDASKLINVNDVIHCTPDCSKGGKDEPNMVNCCICNRWFHICCINMSGIVPQQEIWNCETCRKIPSMLHKIQDEVMLLRPVVADLVKQNADILKLVKTLNEENYPERKG